MKEKANKAPVVELLETGDTDPVGFDLVEFKREEEPVCPNCSRRDTLCNCGYCKGLTS